MTKTTRKNISVKALQTHLALLEKSPVNADGNVRMERKLIGAVNNRGENLSCDDVRQHCECYLDVLGRGATKIAYGTQHLAICFIRDDYSLGLGNQIALQIKAWQQIALTDEAIYFNPVLSYGLHRGDKLTDTDNRYLNKSFIVSQRASFYGGIKEAIINAYKLNHINYDADMVQNYFNAMMEAARKYNIGDLHCENIGVIFDYSTDEYRAVITDYGLTRR